MNRNALARVLAAAVGLSAACAQAQGLSDPTRPPGSQETSGNATDAQDDAPRGTQLQSVLLSRGRKLAVIGGTTVPLGGMLGDARVVKITETEVVLKRGDATEVLKLFPGIEKQVSKRQTRRAAVAGQASPRQGGSQ